jgi:hypothetical protein
LAKPKTSVLWSYAIKGAWSLAEAKITGTARWKHLASRSGWYASACAAMSEKVQRDFLFSIFSSHRRDDSADTPLELMTGTPHHGFTPRDSHTVTHFTFLSDAKLSSFAGWTLPPAPRVLVPPIQVQARTSSAATPQHQCASLNRVAQGTMSPSGRL